MCLKLVIFMFYPSLTEYVDQASTPTTIKAKKKEAKSVFFSFPFISLFLLSGTIIGASSHWEDWLWN